MCLRIFAKVEFELITKAMELGGGLVALYIVGRSATHFGKRLSGGAKVDDGTELDV